MASLTATIKALLSNDESTTLDFKRDQYPFANATDHQKSELIKDTLAFANAFRHQDAYILLGITEGHPATVTGITHHLNDAHLQQLLNTKTNRPIEFSYHALQINGKDIAAIRIPQQARPVYLKKHYGNLTANTVYLRHGSSTSIATPDDIARMGTPDTPTLDLHFADTSERKAQGTHRKITSTALHTPKNIPTLTAKVDILNGLFNPDYYRDSITYATFHQFHKPLGIAITNTSSVTAHDVRITLDIPDLKHHVTITLYPPATPEQLASTDKPKPAKAKHAIELHHTSSAWHLAITFPKVQPRATQYLQHPFYLGAKQSMTVTIAVTIHADNLPTPITTTLTIRVTTTQRTTTLKGALKLYKLG
jgi:hypothetical protein